MADIVSGEELQAGDLVVSGPLAVRVMAKWTSDEDTLPYIHIAWRLADGQEVIGLSMPEDDFEVER